MGSVREGTKCFNPDEIDFACLFMNVVGLVFEQYKIKCNSSSPWFAYTSQNGYLDIRIVAEAFYDAFRKYVLTAFLALGNEVGHLSISNHPFVFRNKISGLQMTWNGQRFQGLVINIDLVPAFQHPDLKRQLRLVGEWDRFFLLAKCSRHASGVQNRFHLSYCQAEQCIMDQLPKYIKDGYIVSKAVRVATIAGQGINLDQLDIIDDIRTDEYVTSYKLKNSLLTLVHNPYLRNKIDKNKYAWALAIITDLEENLVKKEVHAWHHYSYLVNCTDCHMNRACCQKRLVTLRLVKNIKIWLEKNMNDLVCRSKDTAVSSFLASI